MLVALHAHGQPPALIPYLDSDKWGYADTNGNVVINPQWNAAQFFKGDKATVFLRTEKEGRNEFTNCLIDRRGNYIIPPSRNWQIAYNSTGGWSDQLNTTDENGKWGLIDSNNNLLLPYEWDEQSMQTEALSDSFKVVKKNGFWGLIDRSGKLILPYNYAAIRITADLYYHAHAFIVADPDNTSGKNKWGVVDRNGKLIIPMQYSQVDFFTLKNFTGFTLTKQAQNEDGMGFGEQRTFNIWIDYPSMTNRARPAPIPLGTKDTTIGNYLVKQQDRATSIFDKNGKQVLTAYDGIRFLGDTLQRVTLEYHGDSEVTTTALLSMNNLQPIGAPQVKILYHEPPRDFEETGFRGCGQSHLYQDFDYDPVPPASIVIDGQAKRIFFKDAFRYQVQGYLVGRHPDWRTEGITEPKIYAVSGMLREKGRDDASYFAAIDDSLHYVIAPSQYGALNSYNAEDRLATTTQNVIIDAKGNLVKHFGDTTVRGAMMWKGKLYAQTAKRGIANRVTDIAGHAYGLWQRMTATGAMVPQYLLAKGEKAVWAMDDSGKLHALDPEGKLLLPALSGKYTSLIALGETPLVLGIGSKNQATLTDKNNNDILNGLLVRKITPAYPPGITSRSVYAPGASRLFDVTAYTEQGNIQRQFFVDSRGNVYAKKPLIQR